MQGKGNFYDQVLRVGCEEWRRRWEKPQGAGLGLGEVTTAASDGFAGHSKSPKADWELEVPRPSCLKEITHCSIVDREV